MRTDGSGAGEGGAVLKKKQILSLALGLLLGVLLGACPHGAVTKTPEEPAPFRLGLQDNALDRLFGKKLTDPARSQVQLRTYQEQYSQAWQLVYRGLVSRMTAAVRDSGCGADRVLAFWAETDLSWESASEAVLLSWRDFQDEIPGNGSGDYLKLLYGMYLRDRCILLADWLDVRAYLGPGLSSCWEDEDAGFNLEAFRALFERSGLLLEIPEDWTFALAAARLLAADWGETNPTGRGIQSFALWDLDGDGRQELLVSEGWYGTHYAVYRLEGDTLERIWEYSWTYSQLSVLEGNILFVQNTAHQVQTFVFCRIQDGTVNLLNELEAPGDGSYWNQGQEITKTEFDACLAQYNQRARLDGMEGPIFWRPNSKIDLFDWLLP